VIVTLKDQGHYLPYQILLHVNPDYCLCCWDSTHSSLICVCFQIYHLWTYRWIVVLTTHCCFSHYEYFCFVYSHYQPPNCSISSSFWPLPLHTSTVWVCDLVHDTQHYSHIHHTAHLGSECLSIRFHHHFHQSSYCHDYMTWFVHYPVFWPVVVWSLNC